GSIEKNFKTRIADIFFKLKDGKEVVVEIQHSGISHKEIKDRTLQYNQLGKYVLWILHGKGSVVAEFKYPEHKRNIKISIAEKFLHRLYGGRVYYINIHDYVHKITISNPFSLHYSLPDKKTSKIIKKGFDYFYYRNSNFVEIPNWNFLCVEYNGYKLARFYDTHFKKILKRKILTFSQMNEEYTQLDLKKKSNTKKFVKNTIDNFHEKYGKAIIIESICLLIKELNLNERHIKKLRKKNLGF
ncbi:MAG: hypothetical protein EU539_14110, partial [Promethearchaeota archaeon]